MKKNLKTLVCMMFIAISFVSVNSATAQSAMVFQQGNFASDPPPIGCDNTNGCCDCSGGQYNCVCGAASYSQFTSVSALNLSDHQFYVILAKEVISGSTLTVTFKEKLKLKLKTNSFTQKQQISLSPDTCKKLGYASITISAGKYEITGGNTIKFNVKLGKKL